MDIMKEILHVALAYEHAKRALKELEGAGDGDLVEVARKNMMIGMGHLERAVMATQEESDDG